MVFSTDKFKIKKGSWHMEFTIEEFQKTMIKEGYFVEFVEVEEMIKEKTEAKESQRKATV